MAAPGGQHGHLRWVERPSLTEPVLICAFEGWNDAGDAATTAATFLRDQWGGEPFCEIDPEEFYDFTETRPRVELDDAGVREIVWPENAFWHASVRDRDVVFLVGVEPQLRWRTFCEQVVGVAGEISASLVVTLGALLAEVPHSREVPIVGTAEDEELIARLNLRRSQYEGPTGVVGALHLACRQAGLRSASLWGTVPSYVPGAPSPKVALALVERAASLLERPAETTELEIAAAAYERQVNEVVESDDETAGYVAELERRFDESDDIQDPGSLIEEVERFLRDR